MSRFGQAVEAQQGVCGVIVLVGSGEGSRGSEKRVDARALFGECDDVSDAFCATQDGHEPVEAEGDTGVRWGATVERMQQVRKPCLFAGGQLEDVCQDALLQGARVNSNRPTADLLAVEDEVVVLSSDRSDRTRIEIATEQHRDVARNRRSEGMVTRLPASRRRALQRERVLVVIS